MFPPPSTDAFRGDAAYAARPTPTESTAPHATAPAITAIGAVSQAWGETPTVTGTLGGIDGEAAVLPNLPSYSSALFKARTMHAGDMSEGPSESSANIEDTEDDGFKSTIRDTIPNLERFYEQMAAKAKLPGNAPDKNWVLSLARSYRRLSRDKRSRGRLKALWNKDGSGGLSGASSSGLPCPMMMEKSGWSSNTDDSGYDGGYETDADDSELSEWETTRQGHKRKLDALVKLTVGLGLGKDDTSDDNKMAEASPVPPQKTPRALGTQPIGLRLPLRGSSAPADSSGSAFGVFSGGRQLPLAPAFGGGAATAVAMPSSSSTMVTLPVAALGAVNNSGVAGVPGESSGVKNMDVE